MSPAPPDPTLPFSPAAERNRGPILQALASLLPAAAHVLEVASGTGQHAAFFAASQSGWQWQPTEAEAAALPSIAARCAGVPGVAVPRVLNVLAQPWPFQAASFDAVYVANLLHISPWPATAALVAGAAAVLKRHGRLVVYGPFVDDGQPLAPSNTAFDADLRQRNALWGLRRLHDVQQQALQAGLRLEQTQQMPANNLLLVFSCAGASADEVRQPSVHRPLFAGRGK